MKFNTNTRSSALTRNHEGARAFTLSKELELYTAVVTASLNPQFYERELDKLNRIQNLILDCNPVFVAQLAVYAREKMHLRTIPLVLVVELSKIHNGDSLLRKTVGRVVKRADEIMELLAYYQHSNNRWETKKLNKLSKQIQKGLAEAFNKFDEYQFAKYNRKTAVTLKDAICLVHPKAKDENQQILFNKIIADELKTPYTWEVELSRLGQNFSTDLDRKIAFRAKWTELIHSGKLGYMALLRNLRNFLQADLHTSDLRYVANWISNPDAVKMSKQLPFRFLSAYREIKSNPYAISEVLCQSLDQALQLSVENVPGFDHNTKVLIAADVSGSMNFPVSPRSKVKAYDIGLVLGALLSFKCKGAITGVFGNRWKKVPMNAASLMKNIQTMGHYAGEVGLSTNGYKVIEAMIEQNKVMDKVMIFTDMQMWNSRGNTTFSKVWRQYKRELAPKAKLYLFDLAGHGTAPVRVEKNDVYLIGGWSEKIFDLLTSLENGVSVLETIKSIEI